MSGESQQAARIAPAPSFGEIILDVRSQEEFNQGHVASARNIPVHELAQRYPELGLNKDVPIVLYCRSGVRSATAARILAALGWKRVTDIGPMSNWSNWSNRAHCHSAG